MADPHTPAPKTATLERMIVVESAAPVILSRALGIPSEWGKDMVGFAVNDLVDDERERIGAIVAGAANTLDTGASGATIVVVAPEFVVVVAAAAESVVVLAAVAADRRPTAGIDRKCS